MKEKVEQFRLTLPLIQDLRNPALRPRHWDALRSEVMCQLKQEQVCVQGYDMQDSVKLICRSMDWRFESNP